jgi:hypothetical protein
MLAVHSLAVILRAARQSCVALFWELGCWPSAVAMAEAGKVDKAKPKLTAEELMKQFDAHGDGKLEPAEIETMVKELHSHREKADQPTNLST